MPMILATALAVVLLWLILSPVPAQAGTLTSCTPTYERGSWVVNVCVVLIRNDADDSWLAEGRISSNSNKTHMRLSALHLRANGQTVTTAQTDDGYIRVIIQTVPRWFSPRAGIEMQAFLGYRWVWPDGACYPSCNPREQKTLPSKVAYTRDP
jgi:hypothetical protein